MCYLFIANLFVDWLIIRLVIRWIGRSLPYVERALSGCSLRQLPSIEGYLMLYLLRTELQWASSIKQLGSSCHRPFLYLPVFALR